MPMINIGAFCCPLWEDSSSDDWSFYLQHSGPFNHARPLCWDLWSSSAFLWQFGRKPFS